MKLFDAHCHLNFRAYDNDWKEVANSSLSRDIGIINVGTNAATSRRAIELAHEFDDGVYAAVGLHPIHLAKDIKEEEEFDGVPYNFMTKAEKFDEAVFRQFIEDDRVVAIGEAGLDYYHLEDYKTDEMSPDEFKTLQQDTLRQILRFAQLNDMPVIFHCRDAYIDLIRIIKEINGGGNAIRGVVHCFSGSIEEASAVLELGLYIGFTGIVTFPNAKDVQDVVRSVPLERILIETDAPYLASQPVRGKRNEPQYVRFVADAIARLHKTTTDEVSAVTMKNVQDLFHVA
ncbi:MAG: TatD family hydrolase [Candidatus Kerfeldbacteria bacterium]